ncbi:hypothetical protein EDEG_02737 [Edhazardia aedis USNM 41457]|uniref:Uncharacterized protein n=1 Tax=Edhazardia aedis (strain USNM 41457) TaxID=1003232 RepID=J9DN98_EDHAE|nr:hypothetical protein EDEG_02737 [Edhazardia aedis USNM 41457]|eukprot:EJW02857.1 hypothetical protein EDEG_02737 [Edhazardia aedis USNM 41457]
MLSNTLWVFFAKFIIIYIRINNILTLFLILNFFVSSGFKFLFILIFHMSKSYFYHIKYFPFIHIHIFCYLIIHFAYLVSEWFVIINLNSLSKKYRINLCFKMWKFGTKCVTTIHYFNF